MPKIKDAKILILATDGFEQSELVEPLEQLREMGADVEVASPDGGSIRGWQKTDWGEEVASDLKIADAVEADYDALVLPGGQINPDLLRVNTDALELIMTFANKGKVVAAICHAPWLLIETNLVNGRKVTSYKSIRKDMENAGGDWVDQEVVADNGIITSRHPGDIPAFVKKIAEEVEEGRHERAA